MMMIYSSKPISQEDQVKNDGPLGTLGILVVISRLMTQKWRFKKAKLSRRPSGPTVPTNSNGEFERYEGLDNYRHTETKLPTFPQ